MTFRTGITLVAALVLAGCSDSSSRNRAPDLAVDFTTFVKTEIDNTEDDRDAVNINQVEFSFNDQDNEQAFDDLF
ncbi:MAG: hypothetical protein ACQEV6_08935 [Pseudomonadota bacterium]